MGKIIKPLIVFGTRPEVIKLTKLIDEFKSRACFEVTICNTEQQKDLSNQALECFNKKADISLDIMQENQSLADLNSRLMLSLNKIFQKNKYDCVIVQGDTMSVLAAAQAAFYNKIPVFHVEAGLRSYDMSNPFPEEMLRRCISSFAELNFAPTKSAAEALIKENIPADKILVTGNTGIDTLLSLSNSNYDWKNSPLAKFPEDKELVLITVHRRENHGAGLDNIIEVIKRLASKYKDKYFIIPVHLNPNVKDRIIGGLSGIDNVGIAPPLDYQDLIQVLKRCCLVLTDSGGIQEEAPSFGVPILILREYTERNEGVEAGCSKLVGTDTANVYKHAIDILNNGGQKLKIQNPYGDGLASKRIADAVEGYFNK